MRWTFEDHLLLAMDRAAVERALGGGVGPWLDYLPKAQHLRVARSAAVATGEAQPSSLVGRSVRSEAFARSMPHLY